MYLRSDIIGGLLETKHGTNIGLTVDDVEYPVKETPEEILSLLSNKEENNEKASVTSNNRDGQPNRKRRPTRGCNDGRQSMAGSRW